MKTVEKQLENNVKNLAELGGLKEQIQNSSDKILLDEQIKIMEIVKQEMLHAVAVNKKGFSLFGWIAKILAK